MPVFDNLRAQIAQDPAWKANYRGNRVKAESLAQNIPLIHVTGGTDFPLAQLLEDYEGALQVSTAYGEEERNTRRTERDFGMEGSLYFYAGRACPRFGDVAFAFAKEIEANRLGSATPFDTGGLYKGYMQATPPFNTLDKKQSHYAASTVTLAVWRKRFALFVAMYFHPLTDYWDSRPCQIDPEGVFSHGGNTWQSWTFEVRFHVPCALKDACAWSLSESLYEHFRRVVEEWTPTTPLGIATHEWLSLTPPLVSDAFDKEMERWVREEQCQLKS